MKQAQKMQEDMQKAQAELEETIVEGVSGSGLVKVSMNAKKVVKGIEIIPNAIDEDDLTMLEDLIVAALNDGYTKADEIYNSKMGAFGNFPTLLVSQSMARSSAPGLPPTPSTPTI